MKPPAQDPLLGPDGDDVQVSSPSPGNQNETTIDVDPEDREHLIGGANDERFGLYTCAFYSTFDGGRTWGELFFPIPAGHDFAGDPGTAMGPAGEAYFSAIAADRNYTFSSLYVGRSFDGGRTVPSWVQAVGSPPGGFQDKQLIVTDLSSSPLRGTLYMAWTRIANSYTTHTIHVVTSFDQGATWTTPVRVSESQVSTAAAPAVGPNGELYVAWLDYSTSKLQVDVSHDGGLTFGTDVDVASVALISGIPNGSFRANSNPSLGVDISGGPFDGNVYVCWGNNQGTHTDVLFSRSTDGGVTWSPPLVVNDDGTSRSQWFPWLDVDPNGNVNIGFYDRREDVNDRRIGFWVARSSDGGVSFQPNVRVAEQTFDPSTYPNGSLIGDYNGLAASDRTVHAMWADGRNATNDTFTSRVQLAFYGDTDTLSAASGGRVGFTINPGPLYAGASYFVLASISGTSPGYTFSNGLELPLNLDAFTQLGLQLANTPVLPSFIGTLDGTGSATAALDTLGPIANPAAVGLQLSFAVLVTGPGASPWAWASEPFGVTILP
ncbi:MAG: sialidase family protein [Planctomycetota bacterium]